MAKGRWIGGVAFVFAVCACEPSSGGVPRSEALAMLAAHEAVLADAERTIGGAMASHPYDCDGLDAEDFEEESYVRANEQIPRLLLTTGAAYLRFEVECTSRFGILRVGAAPEVTSMSAGDRPLHEADRDILWGHIELDGRTSPGVQVVHRTPLGPGRELVMTALYALPPR